MICPDDIEEFVEFLLKSNAVDEASRHLAELVNDDQFVSARGKSKHDLWTELLTLITKNPQDVKSLNVDAVIRSGIKRYAHEVGNLYNALADYYIRLGLFEKARDVYEEGITSVNTVRDFVLIFDAYTKYEESLLTAKMNALTEEEEQVCLYLFDFSYLLLHISRTQTTAKMNKMTSTFAFLGDFES
jgi:pre-mRNA-splicing factor SYF1